MSVLLVTDDVDDDTFIKTKRSWHDQIYKQIKQLEYDSSGTPYSILEDSSSIIVKSNQNYREDRRRRHCRLQTCLVQPTLTYMFIVLLLAQNLNWPIIFLSLSSMNIITVKVAASKNTRHLSSKEMISDRLLSPSNVFNNQAKNDDDRCLEFQEHEIDRFCSKTCRSRKNPFEFYDDFARKFSQVFYLPFCSNYLVDLSININQILNETTENQCRQTLTKIINSDRQAQNASHRFASYMKAIDSASEKNRYSIIKADCQEAYRTWACAVNIPFFYKNQRIPPCQKICDEVERVCPTFRPSDYEPLFAGQPLFYCNGGVVANSDYGHPRHCYDKCHLFAALNRNHSASSSSFQSSSSIQTFVDDLVTTPPCFKIQLADEVQLDLNYSFSPFPNQSMFDMWINGSLTSSARTFRSSSFCLIWFILFFFSISMKF